ncbi:relaxase/mobilization nuclease domain-containing protein [Sphingobium sp. MI1205]|uniref:relaxase/mobilization nuclease domain-containing protein n=1 Tax=Sphingobium sp. MI1205 TaxID=407020 RepID=UPI0000DD881F|nr:relaxase/mobilization nuclease domain-containing protein [Sphingobium sp. MI1205]AMK20901.1 relaxase [Sphingobium sp. MI1205]BAF30460.1 relaxase [uncultured bacterium]
MSDFDSSFEAGQLAALFKPKLTSDPNRRGTDMLLRSLSSRRAGQGGSTRARLARVVSRAPEVMVKVTGRPKGKNHAAAHLDYIGRKGDVPLETRDGDILTDKEDRAELARDWGDPVYWRDNSTVAAVSMVFSMPAGTDPDKVLSAVREVARSEIADEWDFVMALHTDTPRPHVHLTVAARGDTGRRFNPRPQTLHHYRERFAEELRALGVTAEATPRAARGVGTREPTTALRRARDDFARGKRPQRPHTSDRCRNAARDHFLGRASAPPFMAASREQWGQAQRIYLAAADRLARSKDHQDRMLAGQVREFVRAGRVPTLHEQLVSSLVREKERREGVSRAGPQKANEDRPRGPQR